MVMFDLDGTLLPMDMDEFTTGYFKMLAAKVAPRGYELQGQGNLARRCGDR